MSLNELLIDRCVEISPSLAQKQRETISEVRSHLSKFNVECRDATDRSGWGMTIHLMGII